MSEFAQGALCGSLSTFAVLMNVGFILVILWDNR